MNRAALALLLAALLLLPACIEKKTVDGTPIHEEPMAESTMLYEKRIHLVERPGYTRAPTYFWLEPPKIEENQKYPLVLVLHGSTGNAYAGAYLASPAIQYNYPAFVLVPTAPKNTVWSRSGLIGGKENLPDVMALLDNLAAKNPVDPNRVYVVGCSMGGIGALGAVANYPDTFAAAISISGGWDAGDAAKMKDTDILIIHGALDRNVPVENSRGIANALEKIGAPVEYQEIPNMAHNCPADYLYGPDLWEWLLSKSR